MTEPLAATGCSSIRHRVVQSMDFAQCCLSALSRLDSATIDALGSMGAGGCNALAADYRSTCTPSWITCFPNHIDKAHVFLKFATHSIGNSTYIAGRGVSIASPSRRRIYLARSSSGGPRYPRYAQHTAICSCGAFCPQKFKDLRCMRGHGPKNL